MCLHPITIRCVNIAVANSSSKIFNITNQSVTQESNNTYSESLNRDNDICMNSEAGVLSSDFLSGDSD
jgi:hypothetical protein